MENNKIKVSVIIPVYNTEKYVREAILSITQQSLKELEIIIINDGSTDGSLDIVEKISNKDSRIHIYIRKQIRGYPKREIPALIMHGANISISWIAMTF